jgi:hypothetical protein
LPLVVGKSEQKEKMRETVHDTNEHVTDSFVKNENENDEDMWSVVTRKTKKVKKSTKGTLVATATQTREKVDTNDVQGDFKEKVKVDIICK